MKKCFDESTTDTNCRSKLKKEIVAKEFSRDEIQKAYDACVAIKKAYGDYEAQKKECEKQLKEGKYTWKAAKEKYLELLDELFDMIDEKHFSILWKIYKTNVARKKLKLPDLTETDKAILNGEINDAEKNRKTYMDKTVEEYQRTTYKIMDGGRTIKTLEGK